MINENNKATAIAKYIVEKYNMYEPAKLQRILYFLYLEYLKQYNKKLFNDKFEAWIHGPAVANIYTFIITNDYNFNLLEEEISDDKKKFIDKEIKKYLNKDAFELINESHKTEPWIKARKGLSYDEISHKEITFSSLKKHAQEKDRRA